MNEIIELIELGLKTNKELEKEYKSVELNSIKQHFIANLLRINNNNIIEEDTFNLLLRRD